VLCLTRPRYPAPSGTGRSARRWPPRHTRGPSPAPEPKTRRRVSRTLFGSVRRALGTAPRRTVRTL